QVAGGDHVPFGHGGNDLLYRAAGGAFERADVDLCQRHRKGDSLGRSEVQRRGGRRPVPRVTPPTPRPRADRRPRPLPRAPISRSMVRALTSYSSASSRALRRRGAQARSSSTSAYNRSVRFTRRPYDLTPTN